MPRTTKTPRTPRKVRSRTENALVDRIFSSFTDTPVGRIYLGSTNTSLVRMELPGDNASIRMNVWLAMHFPQAKVSRGITPVLRRATEQLSEYFAGKRAAFDLPLMMVGTDFQVEVWKAVEKIPFGGYLSYGQISRNAGRPKAVRATGRAQGANPLPIIIPCHRVVGADGTLTGYAGGLELKSWLLGHEERFLPLLSKRDAGWRLAKGLAEYPELNSKN
ncbi:MAG TPA: methylated-DNA--[protein]-cysteine S-methyltransferase [Deltaproteobacteria bacterium]|nr:methylated-DNA--[protein]-cysteine S-methyltransferase [Candidatus Binatota bacterium]HIL14375.1 methylated-DNA--[protein]-cysteine S-methyltransferase [Deltaproteobacteria bacterium]